MKAYAKSPIGANSEVEADAGSGEDEIPADFDPDEHPIIDPHYLGLVPSGVREVWWSISTKGPRLPAEPGVILLDGGRE